MVQSGYDAMVRGGVGPDDVFVDHLPVVHTTGAPSLSAAASVSVSRWCFRDLGTIDARGSLTITGRVKEMIIRGGENLFPAEIENAMLEHDAIAECAVVGIAGDTWGEVVACFMRAAGARQPADADLKAFIRARLAPHKTPQHGVLVDEWPLTGSGKIQKFKLRESFGIDVREPQHA